MKGETAITVVRGTLASLMLVGLCWAAYLSGPIGRRNAVFFFGALAIMVFLDWRKTRRKRDSCINCERDTRLCWGCGDSLAGEGQLPIGYISSDTLADLKDPAWRAKRGEPAALWTTDAPPSRAVIPVYAGPSMVNSRTRLAAAQVVRDCLNRDQADDDNRPLELWIADAVFAVARPKADEELWLWRDGDRYLAFAHEYPSYPCGDPMTLGEPVGRARFVVSLP